MQAGGGQLASSNIGAPALAAQMDVLTDTDGCAQFYVKLPNQEGATVNARATAGGTEINSLWAYTRGLAASWSYEEVSGATAVDGSANARDGDLAGSPDRLVGPFGQSLALNGVDQGMSRGNSDSGLFAGGDAPFSLSFWFKANTIPAGWNSTFLINETYLTNGFRCAITSYVNPPKIVFWSTQSGGTVNLTSTTVPEAGKWYHVVVVYEPDNARLYINGVEEAVNTTALVKSNANVLYAGLGVNGNASLDGQMDELRVYHGALTPEQIAGLDDIDTDGDGLPDYWEVENFTNLAQTAAADPDGDGLSNLQEYQQGSDPSDFYNGQPPVLSIVEGNNQGDLPGLTLARPFAVRVSDSSGTPKPNAPVIFSIQSGGGLLSPVNGGITDASGIASASLQLPSTVGATILVKAACGGVEVTFTATVSNPSLAPNAPGQPEITEEHGASEVFIKWEDRSDNETAFYVERSFGGGEWTRLATLPANTTSYTDTTVAADTVYFYRIVAHNEAPE